MIIKRYLYFCAINCKNKLLIEINPTGEWAWLVEASGFNIQNSICDLLIGEK